jgi:hypothetical protein
MKIELDLPDWVDERHIRILAGIELAAQKLSFNNFWQVKETRCNQCGECCMNWKKTKHYYPVINGRCVHLKKVGDGKYDCSIALYRSFNCCKDPTTHIENGTCCITYRDVPCR